MNLPVVQFGQNHIIVNECELFQGVPWTVLKWVEPVAGPGYHQGFKDKTHGLLVDRVLNLGDDISLVDDIRRQVRCWLPESHKVYDYLGRHSLYYWGEVLLTQRRVHRRNTVMGRFERTEKSETLDITCYVSYDYFFEK